MKFKKRIQMWKAEGVGLHWRARVYDVFASSTLMYIAQFELPDRHVMGTTEAAMFQLASGPATWASREDLWMLKERFAQAISFTNLSWAASA